MAFHFTEEDFKRPVTVDEHGGRHIWHELQDRLKVKFDVPFSVKPWERGDWIKMLWFRPKGTPRPLKKWANQAQFFLARSIEEKRLSYGLMIECPTLSDVAEYGYDQDRDGARLVELLEHDGSFNQLLNDLVRNQGFSLEVNVWDKGTHSPSDAAELLTVLKSLPPEQGWGTHIQRVLSASEAIASGENIADRIMDAYRATWPLFEVVVPDSVRKYLANPPVPQKEKTDKQGNRKGLAGISAHFAAHGLHFTPEQLATFYTALKTKGFVILTGISGTGKTKLAQYFAELLGSKGQFHFAAVRPDWRDSKSLLGYFNPLLGEKGQFQSTDFLGFILRAKVEYDQRGEDAHPYFVLLDEMNLAKVEYYFADFLSVLESGRRDEDLFTKEAIRFQYPEGIDGPPPELRLPPNLYFIGTVNVDETTYMFSPKVLDRAFTLELSTVEFPEYINSTAEGELELLPDEQQSLLDDFTRGGKFATIGEAEKEQIKALAKQPDGKYTTYAEHLTTLNTLLQPHDLHFGYRVFDEIMMFLANAEGSPVFDGFGPDELDAAFDAAVLMKVLPKFHGTRGKLGKPLEKMVGWAREPGNPEAGCQALSDKLQKAEGIASLREDLRRRIKGGGSSDADAFAYPRTALKALRMLHDLYTTGFASFA